MSASGSLCLSAVAGAWLIVLMADMPGTARASGGSKAMNFTVVRQLTIMEFAHKARVVSDLRMGALLAARDMAAERRGAAALDRTHHLRRSHFCGGRDHRA